MRPVILIFSILVILAVGKAAVRVRFKVSLSVDDVSERTSAAWKFAVAPKVSSDAEPVNTSDAAVVKVFVAGAVKAA